MRGGFLIATDRGLFDRAAEVLVAMGGVQAIDEVGDRLVQFLDTDERLFTLYQRVLEGTDWEVREGDFSAAPGVQLPDMNLVTACPFDCRWPALTAHVAEAVARTAETPTWVLDGHGVLWAAEAVDPYRVQL